MSISILRKPSNGRHIVPLWFKDILHAIIYSDCVQAYIAIHAIALFLGAETHDRRILALHAHGLNHTQIAARLKVSRYSIIRAMNRLLKLAYSDTLQRMQKSPMAADILDKFLARNYTHSENIHTAIAFLWGLSCTELGVLSALLRGLPESEAIEHACVSKSRYHTVKKHLLELLDLGRKSAPKKVAKKSWSLRETDRFDIICGVNGNVYFSVHFEGFILRKIRYFPPLLAVMFSPKRPINAKSA
jgi:predicted transcriptional regulator